MKNENQTQPTVPKTWLPFGLNNTKCPPHIKDLVLFAENLIKLVKNL